MRVFLETERLVLRRFTEHDVDSLVELDSDPEVMRFIDGGGPTPREVIERDLLADGRWAAVDKVTGEFLGWFALRQVDDSGHELGYRLRRAAWGKGYATEGSLALIDKAFTELGARRIFATTMTVNAASRRVMEKLGMTFVRTFFESWPEYIEGAEHGDVEYELLPPDEPGGAQPTIGS